ncbi:unnamed protein product [Cochlearia groenlandica]
MILSTRSVLLFFLHSTRSLLVMERVSDHCHVCLSSVFSNVKVGLLLWRLGKRLNLGVKFVLSPRWCCLGFPDLDSVVNILLLSECLEQPLLSLRSTLTQSFPKLLLASPPPHRLSHHFQ